MSLAPPNTTGDESDELDRLLGQVAVSAEARERVVTLLYPDLKRIADAHMRRERPDHTLQATALVNEFFVEFARHPGVLARHRAQFLMVASLAMRRCLVDHARSRRRVKRGGALARVDLDAVEARVEGAAVDPVEILEVDQLLEKLAHEDPRMARIVELRYFGGLTNAEVAEVVGVHERTVKRDWQVARAWLYGQLRGSPHAE